MKDNNFSNLSAIYVNCSLKKSPATSHTSTLMKLSQTIMEKEGVSTKEIRLIDYEVAVGMKPDMTEEGWEKDDWPMIFEQIMDADILIIGTPIWLGEKSSVAQKLIERLYSSSGETNDKGQYIYYGKVGGCMITGNEDGAKHCAMGILYSLQHIGYSIPPQADCSWLGEVGPGPSYGDTMWNDEAIDPPVGFETEFTNKIATFMTYNIMHLASMLKAKGGYSNYGNSSKAWNEGIRWKFESPKNI